jgi:hypothetical protein
MQSLIYNLKKTSKETFDFTSDWGVKYTIYLTSLNHLSHLFIGEDLLSEKNFYYLVLERKSHFDTAKHHDLIIKRTVASCLFQFFTDNKEAIVLFNFTNADNKIEKRRALFYRWFSEYGSDTRFTYYQKDFNDVASICALYRKYSAHPNFVEIEEKIRVLIEQISSGTSKT